MNEQKLGEIWLRGHTVVPGIAVGLPLFLQSVSIEKNQQKIPQEHVEEEVQKFRRAALQNQKELQELHWSLSSSGFSQEASFVEVSLSLATDPVFLEQIEQKIRLGLQKAEQAVCEVRTWIRDRFEKLSDAYLRMRFEDIDGVCDRLLSLLSSEAIGFFPVATSGDTILCAQSVTAPLAAQVSVHGIGAIVTTCGGAMSHTAIVARSKGIPYVSDINVHSMMDIAVGEPIIVDGVSGVVILRPHEETMRRYMNCRESQRGEVHSPISSTKDGYRVHIFANVAKESDIHQVHQYSLDGVGLYRTEYQVLEKGRFPSEEEQVRAYSEMVKGSKDKPLVMRVFDFGSDKEWDTVLEKIPHKVHGKRALSLLLECPDVLRMQLRAFLRASKCGPFSIVFPMVSSVQELESCIDHLRSVYEEMNTAGDMQFPSIGAMLEIPSILFHMREVAEKVDFLSLGTNDLIQYSLAVDRSNTAAFDYRIAFHPGLMHLLHYAVRTGKEINIPMCICGEMASDPLLVPFLVGIGVTELSMAPRLAPLVRRVLRSFTRGEMQDIAERVLKAQSAQEIYVILRAQYASVHAGEEV